MELKLMLSNLKTVPLAGMLFFYHGMLELILLALLRYPRVKHKKIVIVAQLLVLASWFLTTATYALWRLYL